MAEGSPPTPSAPGTATPASPSGAPTPPPYPWPTAPSASSAWSPGGWGPSPLGARRGLERIWSSIGMYRWVPVLSLVGALLAAVAAVAFGVGISSAGFGSSITVPAFNNSSATSPTPPPAGVAALGDLGLLVALAVLVLTLVAWLGWRNGLRELRASAGTAWSPPADVERAHRYYVITLIAFVLYLVAVLTLAGAVAAEIVSAVTPAVIRHTPIDTAALAATVRATIIVGLVIGAALATLMYFAAGTSLASALRAQVPAPDALRLDRARYLLAIGGAWGLAGLAGFVDGWLLFVAVVGPALQLLALVEFRSIYGAWLGAHPPDGALPSSRTPATM